MERERGHYRFQWAYTVSNKAVHLSNRLSIRIRQYRLYSYSFFFGKKKKKKNQKPKKSHTIKDTTRYDKDKRQDRTGQDRTRRERDETRQERERERERERDETRRDGWSCPFVFDCFCCCFENECGCLVCVSWLTNCLSYCTTAQFLWVGHTHTHS